MPGAYKPHPVWKPNDMQACPVCSAYVPKCLFEFHRCPAGSGVRRSSEAVMFSDLSHLYSDFMQQLKVVKPGPEALHTYRRYTRVEPGVISDEPPAPKPLSPWARWWKVLWLRVCRVFG